MKYNNSHLLTIINFLLQYIIQFNGIKKHAKIIIFLKQQNFFKKKISIIYFCVFILLFYPYTVYYVFFCL